MDELLSLIIDYKMDKTEAKAWKVSILYMELSKKYFPDYNHYRLGKGDPRKSNIFKHCYKLVKENRLENSEFRLYITAQLQIMKNIDAQTLISPACLTGEKAWKRWLLWKNKFFKNTKIIEEKPKNSQKAIKSLKETYIFLNKKLDGFSKEKIIVSLNNRNLFRWCAGGEVCGYYLILSPTVNEWRKKNPVDLLDCFAIDVKVYNNDVNEDVVRYFESEFQAEYDK